MARGTKLTTALWLLLAVPAAAVAADAAGSGARSDGGKAADSAAAPAGQQDREVVDGPKSPAQPAVVEDLREGQRQCAELAGKERAACDARAAATAQTPRGRQGANPTGSGRPATGSGSSGG